MSTELTLQIESDSSEQTEQIGELLGSKLRGGEIIELSSDLGGGKTTLVRGIARGAGSLDIVSSPTFTVSKLYRTADFEIHHFDFYRLGDPGLMLHEVHDLLDDTKVVLVIEWAGAVRELLPEDRIHIDIQKTGNDHRLLQITTTKKHQETVQALNQFVDR